MQYVNQWMGVDDTSRFLCSNRVKNQVSFLVELLFYDDICVKRNIYHILIIYRVRVSNELGAGNGKGAKFATIVAVATSTMIGLMFWLLIMIFHNELALIFSSSEEVLAAVNKLSILLAFTILLNSVQPILSGKYKLYTDFQNIFTKQRSGDTEMLFIMCRGCCWIWMAILCGIH